MGKMEDNQSLASGRSRGKRSKSSANSQHRRRTRLIQALGVGLVISAGLNLVLLSSLAIYYRDVRLMEGVTTSLEERLAAATTRESNTQQRIVELEQQIDELTKQRLPGLLALNYDEVIALDKKYVKNVVFTRTGKKDARLYEYKLVLENQDKAVVPALKVTLFDRAGVQLGESDLTGNPLNGGLRRLEAGEVRTHYATINLPNDSDPVYFKIHLM